MSEIVENEVILLACEPIGPISVNHVPDWYLKKCQDGLIEPIEGDIVDGSDWMYLNVWTPAGAVVCKTDQVIVLADDGSLSVKDQ